MDTNTNTRDWTHLPKELLAIITKRLDSRVDTLRLRAACRSFRKVLPPPPKPLSPYSALKIPLPPGANPSLRGHLLLNQSTVYAIEPLNKISDPHKTTKTWLLKVEELSSSNKVRVKDPFYKFPYEGLSKKLPKSLNLLDYRVKELAKAYGFEFVHVGKGKGKGKGKESDDFNVMRTVFFKKVVVNECLDEIDDGFVVMGIYTGGKMLAWRKIDERWTNVEFGSARVFFEDVVYDDGKFYALTSNGVTISVDSESLYVTEVSVSAAYGHSKYLIKSFKGMYLVDKHMLDEEDEFGCEEDSDDDQKNYPIHLNVYKFDKEKGDWVQKMENLEDMVLFCSYDCSFSISGKEFLGCKNNCVYFTDDAFDEVNDDHPGWDAGMFDIGDGTLGKLSDFPGYSKIFWPPPTWLKKSSN